MNEDLEYYSVIRSIRAIEDSDVCILMLDATRGIERQDLNIFSLIQRNQKGLVVVVNKWDLVEDKSAKVMKTLRKLFVPFCSVCGFSHHLCFCIDQATYFEGA